MMKVAKLLLLSVGIISIVIWAMVGGEADTDQNYIGTLLYLSYALLIISGIVIAVSTLSFLVTHPAMLKKSLLTLGVFGLVVASGFIWSDDTVIRTSQGVSTEAESAFVGAFLKIFYILLFATIAIMLFFGLKRIVKN